MRISVGLDNGLLPDRFGKHAPEAYQLDGHPVRSFPIEIADVPEGARSLALTFLDYDAVPVGGFCWIHWLACDIAPDTTLVPENASASGELACVQGSNSDWSPLAGSHTDPRIIHRYAGPYPPDKTHDYTLTVYALDCELGLSEGYFLNEFRRAVRGHVLDEAIYAVDSRVLVLGTMPSPKSREIGFYYGHPQNRFWKVMGALFDEPEPLGIEGRTAFLYAHGIALWDVLSSCAIVGASDASIVDPVANDLSRIAEAAPLEAVFTTGSKATALYRRSCESVFADSRNFGTPGRRRAMSFCEVVARFAGRRGREKEESWRHARGRVDS